MSERPAIEVLRDAYEYAAESGCDSDGGSAPIDKWSAGDAIIRALDAAGYVIVPKEPTRAMLDAAYVATRVVGDAPKGLLSPRNKMRTRYVAMLAASQQKGG